MTGSDPVVFNVGAPTAALGTYTTTLKGVSGGLTATAKLTIIVSSQPPNGGAAPTDPSYVSAASNSTSVIVNWAAVTNAANFKLDRKVSGGSYSELATLPATQTTYTDTALTLGTSYVYRVRTVSVQGTITTGRESPTVTFTGPTTPGSPPLGGPPGCCKVCTGGKPCGDTCIAYNKTCHTPGGCACSGSAVVFIRLKDCPNAAKIPVIGLDAAGHEHVLMSFEEWIKLPTSVKLLNLN